ncbi:MAG: hypothetical protein V2A78_01415 [bacterium]
MRNFTESRQLTDLLRNPTTADLFHRAGAVEVWGRGTNRVIAMCKMHGCLKRIGPDKGGRWEVLK